MSRPRFPALAFVADLNSVRKDTHRWTSLMITRSALGSAIDRPLPLLSLLLGLLASSGTASAQTVSIDTRQSDLVKKPAAEQSAILADAVRGAWKGRNCSSPKVSLEKTHDDRGGGWLVSCEEGQDYWALVGGSAKIRGCGDPLHSGAPVRG
jgi:hypothetical protein